MPVSDLKYHENSPCAGSGTSIRPYFNSATSCGPSSIRSSYFSLSLINLIRLGNIVHDRRNVNTGAPLFKFHAKVLLNPPKTKHESEKGKESKERIPFSRCKKIYETLGQYLQLLFITTNEETKRR